MRVRNESEFMTPRAYVALDISNLGKVNPIEFATLIAV